MVNYSTLLFNNDSDYQYQNQALEIVLAFIKKKKNILVGGQAIDYALRLKGESIYDEEEIPDYDFYSTTPYQDAIELGNILCRHNLPEISVIRAMHITTMRVRVNFYPVADITYCPPAVYEELQTLNYKGIRIIHPHVQMIDSHHSLSYPYENPSMEVIFHRWAKDVCRYNIVTEKYPIPDETVKTSKTTKFNPKWFKDVCYTGYAAQAIYDETMELYKPEIAFLTNDFDKWAKKYNGKIYNPYLGRFPRSYHVKGSDVKGDAAGINLIIYDNTNAFISAIPHDNYHVASQQHVLMLHLHNGDFYNYNKIMNLVDDLPITYYGVDNLPESYIFNKKQFYDPTVKSEVPKNLYPKQPQCDIAGEFNYNSQYFQIDGRPVK